MMQIPDFGRLFVDKALRPSWWGNAATLEVREVGRLTLVSGLIAACDSFVDSGIEPFALQIPAGAYPVVLSIAHLEYRRGERDQRTAAAMLRFNDQKPVRWAMATTARDNLAAAHKRQVFGYGVDSGTGSFMDIEAARLLERRYADDAHYFDTVADEMEETYVHTRSWGSILLDNATGLNAVLFSSGMGDGFYVSYWGYAENDQVACLVTDFKIIKVEP